MRYLESNGLLDSGSVAIWEIEQSNKEALGCNHLNEDGSSAFITTVGMDECRKCGADDYYLQ